MLDPEPLVYPSRNGFPYNPGVPDRQLWAIGMIVVQWSMTEFIIDQQIRQLIGDDEELIGQYAKRRNFQQRIDLWQSQIETKLQDPHRSKALSYISRIQNLNSQRDEVIHRAWGGGMQSGSWNAENYPTTDATLLRKPTDKFKTKSADARATLKWRLMFSGLRKIARDMATLNRDLFVSLSLPPTD
jgi:hypothetical protein